jgi:predicted glycogen debranching enzyme
LAGETWDIGGVIQWSGPRVSADQEGRPVIPIDDRHEWLEADGLGGFASGTTSGVRTRRYHALLLPATRPPAGRQVLVNGFEAWVETARGVTALTSQRYAPGVVHPDGASRIEEFRLEPWPTWILRLPDGARLVHELFSVRGRPVVVVSWRLLEPAQDVKLHVRPLLSGRDYHALHRENGAFRFDAVVRGASVTWRPYPDLPPVVSWSNGTYAHAPDWYRNFLYLAERERGLDDVEDLASPGVLTWDLSADDAFWMLGAQLPESGHAAATDVADRVRCLRADEAARRAAFPTTLHRSADAYIVDRGGGRTIIAGYPWFTDWGRDTFIAMRGICLATGRLEEARQILLAWAATVSQGMLPNRFPDLGSEPEYNSVDASLWYVIAVHEYLEACGREARAIGDEDARVLRDAIEQILAGYARGTRYGIAADSDGLLASGEPGVQLTWMDAKIGDWVVTPRTGKAVEIQALWLNALRVGSAFSDRWREPLARGMASFAARFWNEAGGCLYDVVDADHRPGAVDATCRANQILAVGGLPMALVDGERARAVVERVEQVLLTPLGLRSLAPGEDGYTPRYEGGPAARDASYHRGTVWPWLIGPFVDAWLRTRADAAAAREEAIARFLRPLRDHLDEAGLGHVAEICDADAPFTPRGCPFQAWSLGELIRLERVVLARRAQPSPACRTGPDPLGRQDRAGANSTSAPAHAPAAAGIARSRGAV